MAEGEGGADAPEGGGMRCGGTGFTQSGRWGRLMHFCWLNGGEMLAHGVNKFKKDARMCPCKCKRKKRNVMGVVRGPRNGKEDSGTGFGFG